MTPLYVIALERRNTRAELLTMSLVTEPVVPGASVEPPICSVPLLIVVGPIKVLAAVRIRVPVPRCSSVPPPEILRRGSRC